MAPRDMARLGFLMLNNGTWDGNEIVSSEWVSEATRTHAMTPWTYGYGYQWWTFPDYGVYAATGHYEQKIYVIPEHDTVVVFTANIADEDPHPTDYFVFAYVLPSIEIGSEKETETFVDLVNSSIAVLLVIPLAMVVIFWLFKIRRF
jgi:CubicO group peptidase (beta-lactamase class C family)